MLMLVLALPAFGLRIERLCFTSLSYFFFSSRRRHTRWTGDWNSDVCSSDLLAVRPRAQLREAGPLAHGVHDRYRGGGYGQRDPAIQRSRPGVADEVLMASLFSPTNEPHSRVINHTLATDACGVEQRLHVM